MSITTHVLDTATGRPASHVPVHLELLEGHGHVWSLVGSGSTDADGRCKTLVPPGAPVAHGIYRLRFDTAAYLGAGAFFPTVEIVFAVHDDRHHHVPLLLSPFGYSTYRGS